MKCGSYYKLKRTDDKTVELTPAINKKSRFDMAEVEEKEKEHETKRK